MTHPGVVRNGEGEVLPVHGFEITENTIDNTKSCFQIRVALVMSRPHDWMTARDGLEHSLVGLVTNALALDCEMEEGLGAEICLVPEFRDNDGTSG